MPLDPGQYVARLTELLAARGQPPDVLQRASAYAQQQRLGLNAALVALGVDEGLLLQLAGEASGLPVAQVLPAPEPGVANGFDATRCRAMPMAPLRREGDLVLLACTDPLVALTADARALPPFRLVLASEQAVRQALQRLFGEAVKGAERTAVSGKHKPHVPTTSRTEVATKPMAQAGDELPKVLGGFERLELIGQGGMASVFRGREVASGRLVALKVMLPSISADKDFVARFLQEARATRHLAHPNVVTVLGYGREGNQPWMASEFIDRGTVEELLGSTGPMPAPLALEVFAQALAGVGAAHAEGIVHRDLKPANLLISSDGLVKVGDFGIAKVEGAAKLTQTGIVIGTPAYMSPEQANARALTPASDLFSMGIILYELLTGTNPHNAESAAAAMVKVLAGAVPPITQVMPTLDPALDPFLEKLLAREPGDRPTSVPALLEEVGRWLAPWRAGGQNLVAFAIGEPRKARAAIAAMEAQALFDQAKPLLGGGVNEKRRAAMLLYRASVLDGANPALAKTFEEVCAAEKLRVGRAENPKIKELEESLSAQPDAPGVLQQLSNLYRLEGNIFRAADYMRQYVKLRPHDGYAVGQLAQLTGVQPALGAAAAAQVKLAASAKPGAGGTQAPGFRAPPSDGFVEYGAGAGSGGGALQDLLSAYGRPFGILAALGTFSLMTYVLVSRFAENSARESSRGSDQMMTDATARSVKPRGPRDELSDAREAVREGRNGYAVEALDTFFSTASASSPLRGEGLVLRAEAQLRLDRLPNAQMDATDALLALPPGSDDLVRRAKAVLAKTSAPPPPPPRPPEAPPPPPPQDGEERDEGGAPPTHLPGMP